MPAFIVATVTISDMEAFKAYGQAVAGLSEKHGGKSIVKGQISEVLEGNVPTDQRVVVSEFPTEEAAKAYINDPLYLEGKARREGAAVVEMRLIITE